MAVRDDLQAARMLLEAQRWPDGVPVCPHCGAKGRSFRLSGKPDSDSPARAGLWKCGHCRKQFTVTVGTIFHGSRIPLDKWLLAIRMLCDTQDGLSARELHRRLGIGYRPARLMLERIRHAASQIPLR